MTVRSSVLAAGFLAAGTQPIATVPAGETWIVKDVSILSQGSGTNNVQLYVVQANTSNTGIIFLQAMTQGQNARPGTGFFVLQAGDQLTLSCNVLTKFWVSGAKLVGIA